MCVCVREREREREGERESFFRSSDGILKKNSTESINYSTKYLEMCEVYTDEGGIKKLYHGLSTCTIDIPDPE